MDIDPYEASAVGGDLSDDNLPSFGPPHSTDDDIPDDLDYLNDTAEAAKKKKKKKEKEKEKGEKRSATHENKAIATWNIVANLPKLTAKYLSEFAESFSIFVRRAQSSLVGM